MANEDQNTNQPNPVVPPSREGAVQPRVENRPGYPRNERSGQRPGGDFQRNRPPMDGAPGGRRPFNGPRRNDGKGDMRRKPNDGRKKPDFVESNIESQIIEVRRVSKTVKGGKKMRYSAMVIAGNKEGSIGFAIAKGLDFQDAVSKATRKAKERMVHLQINSNFSVSFPVQYKYKSSIIYLKPAQSGTGLIAGGFLRSVLQLAGIQNVYSKVIGSNNKIVGVRAAVQALGLSFGKKELVKV